MKSPLELSRVSLKGDRKLNQDRCLSLSKGSDTLLVLGDGLGGHPRGEIAAQLLVDSCEHLFRNTSHPVEDPLGLLTECLERAHAAIVRFGITRQPPIAPRTTGVVCLVQGGRAWWCHVGDSRLYLFRDGKLLNQTRDHTKQHFPGDKGEPRLSITRCLGGLGLPPDLSESGPFPLEPGDVVLLSSDGFWAQHEQRKLGERLYQPGQLGDNLARLAAEACQRAAPRSDNTSVIAMRWWPPGTASNATGQAQTKPA